VARDRGVVPPSVAFVEDGRQLRPFRMKGHGDGVHAVARVRFRESLAFEDMAQMSLTIGADDLGALAIGIRKMTDGALEFSVEAGPAATAVELGPAVVEPGVALATEVGAHFGVVGVLADPGRLGALVQQDVLLFGRKRVVVGHESGLLAGVPFAQVVHEDQGQERKEDDLCDARAPRSRRHP